MAALVTSMPAQAAAGSGTGRALVVRPLTLVANRELSFGNITSGPSAGTVRIDEDTGARTTTGGVTALGGTVSAAQFTGAGTGLNLVIIRTPATPVTLRRSGGSETMQITDLEIQGTQVRILLTTLPFTVNVGGTLAVGANQREGTYVGTFNVTVDYY